MNRRQALHLLAASSLGDVSFSAGTRAEDRILELDCTNLLGRIRDGSLRAEQVCERFLQQYERQKSLNAVTWIDPSAVLSRARSVDQCRDKGARLPALAGLPILIKDNIDIVGMPTSAGTAFLKGHVPQRTSPVVETLLQQGAIVMGKANMHELSLGFTSSNPTFGFVHNPYNVDLIPGGSSGGSAAAVAARIVPAALGTDTGASVRIPAALCGVVGFRPSVFPRRLYSHEGVVPLSLDLDTIGPMGRSVDDVALLHATIMGQNVDQLRSLEGVRIGIPRVAYWEDLDPEVERISQSALTLLRDRGTVLVDIDLREVKQAALQISYKLLSTISTDLGNFLRTRAPSVSLRDVTARIASRDVRALMAQLLEAGPVSDLLYARGVGRKAACAAYLEVFRQHGIQAVVFPTAVLPPPPIRVTGDDTPDEMIMFNGRMVSISEIMARNTLPTSALGAPALSLPVGLTSKKLPVALEFDGLPGNDNALLALGSAAEAAIGRISAPPHAMTLSTACL